MHAVIFLQPGDEAVLHLGDAPAPALGRGEVRLRVLATAVNRADLLQRRGLYPAPAGASPILGLECVGVITEYGPDTNAPPLGTRVMALLAGGGYAEQVVVDAGSLIAAPAAFSDAEAAGFMETFVTAFTNLIIHGRVVPGDSVLVHGGGSGIGTAALSLCRAAGVRVFVTAGSDAKCARCRELGAALAINYRTQDFVSEVLAATDGRGVTAVLDSIGAPYFDQNLAVLTSGGRLLLIGLQGGAKGAVNLAPLLAKRLSVIGSTLRALAAPAKAEIITAFLARFGEALAAGALRPIIDRELPLADAALAQRVVQAGEHFGKVVLRVAAPDTNASAGTA